MSECYASRSQGAENKINHYKKTEIFYVFLWHPKNGPKMVAIDTEKGLSSAHATEVGETYTALLSARSAHEGTGKLTRK